MTQAQRGVNAMANLQVVMGRFVQEVDAWSRALAEGRSAGEVQFFKDVLITAVAEKPDLLFADRRTFYNSAKKCFLDGCLPDGRDAALVVYRTKIKARDSDGIDVEATIDAVQYMPMVQGIRRKMLESGFVTFAFADAVYEKDSFRHIRGLNASIEHETPSLGADRGKLIGAYAIIKLANGETLLDSMGEKEILAAKAQGRAGDSSLLWSKFPWEGYKKTVLRRLAKSAPVSPNIRRLVDREDEPADGEIDLGGTMRSGAPRFDHPTYNIVPDEPEPEAPVQTGGQVQQQPLDEIRFGIWDLDGAEATFASAFAAFDGFLMVLSAAANIGVAAVDGFWESNQDFLDQLSASGNENLATELAQRFADARDRANKAEAEAASKADALKREQEQVAAAEREKIAAAERAADTERQRREEAAAEDARAAAQGERQGEEPAPAATTAPRGQSLAGAAATAEAGEARPSKKIVVPMGTDGKADYRVFAVALLGPKIKATKTSNDLADLLGDNEEAIQKCRGGSLEKAHLEGLEETIKTQWSKLPADS
jgi:recombinational DNA repair protein RecT